MDQHITWREGALVTAEQAIEEYVRASTVVRVAQLREEAALLLARASKIESDPSSVRRFWSWPFCVVEDGVYMASPGVWLGACEEAAQHLANVMRETVRFSHDEQIREATPEPKAAP